VVGGFAAAGLHPYLNLAVSMMSLATIGVMVLMLGASVSVVAFFVRRPAERHWWRTAVAPVLAALGLGTATLLVLAHYSFITGTDSALINGLPWLILVVVFAGAGRALWLRARDHAAFAAMHPEAVALTLDAEPTAA
jgi:hypothetical protein